MLLDMLLGSTSENFDAFCDALKDTEQDHIVINMLTTNSPDGSSASQTSEYKL